MQGAATDGRSHVHGFQIHRTWLERAGQGFDDPDFPGRNVGRFSLVRREEDVPRQRSGDKLLSV